MRNTSILLFVLAFTSLLVGARVANAYNSTVTVDSSITKATISATGFGIHTSVYDNRLTHASVPQRLTAAGVTVLSYPGGGYADAYHWSENRNTAYFDSGNLGYIAANADFGSFAKMVGGMATGQMMITVNYGSSLQGDSGGEPKEAAAWVAYCNGSPNSTQIIGLDSRGNDWQTVGYWASLRAAQPLAVNDGKNFLRIGRAASLNCQLWEIGNELFGNGYFNNLQIENDWHANYGSTIRVGNPALSPTVVGNNVRAYIAAMKAVDPTIKIGVPVSNPPHDDTWGPQWDQELLQACGDVVQFVAIHDYAGFYQAPNYTTKDPADVLLKSGPDRIAETVSLMQGKINAYTGGNAANVRIAVTEANGNPLAPGWEFTNTLLAANVYAGFLANGVFNVDWLEMHTGFLTDDDAGTPQAPYYAVQLVNLLMAPGDQAITTSSSNSLLDTYASHKANGDLGLLFVNTSPTDSAVATVTLTGFVPQTSGTLYAFDRDAVQYTTASMSGLASSFSITVPAYSIRQIMVSPSSGAPADFTLSSGSATLSVTQGATATASVNITRSNFSNGVDFSASGLPAGVSVSFNLTSSTGNTTTATFTATSTAATGPATVTIIGTSGGTVRNTTVALTVVAASTPTSTGGGGGGGGQFEILTLLLLGSLLMARHRFAGRP